jgi:hypothetical protein
MAKKLPKRAAAVPQKQPLSRSRRLIFVLLLLAAAGIPALAPDARGWQPLKPDFGRIRWVETSASPTVDPPLAPEWVRNLHRRGIPWPTDLPLTPPGASFGANPGAAAWFLVQSNRPSLEMWTVDKRTVKLTDAAGREVPWPGGSGAALVDAERRLQYVYLGVPRELSGTGARVRFRLTRFQATGPGPTSEEVSLPF